MTNEMTKQTCDTSVSACQAAYASALNKSLEIFISHTEDSIDDVMSNGLWPIVNAAFLDRIIVFRIWSKETESIGEIYRWDKEKGGSTPVDEALKKLPMIEAVKHWMYTMSDGSCISLKRSEFTEGQAAFLAPRGVQSILIVPVFIKQEFWGVVTFHDNTTERDFDDDCTTLLRSAARLCANTLIVEERTRSSEESAKALKRRKRMSDVLNEAAIMFLAQREDSFEDMMTEGIRLIADVMDLDRVTVWRNFKTPTGLCASQIYRWARIAGGTTAPTAEMGNVSYAKVMPRWEGLLSGGKSINSPVNLLPEADFLKSFGCLSLFVAPVLMENEFWGNVFFEDLRVERFFDEDNADIMRSAAFLCANTVNMYEMIERQRNEARRLEGLVAERTVELNRQNSLMRTVNAAAAILLGPETIGDLNAIDRSMEMVCQSVNTDRVHLWQNIHKDDGRLYYREMCRWTSAEYAMPDIPEVIEFDYDHTPLLQNLFSGDKSLNGPIDSLSKAECEFFSEYKVQSILAVPLLLDNEMWGFVSFDDCCNRRFFPEADEHTLRSWGMLVMGAMLRGNILRDLKKATDEARNASEAKSRFLANMSHEMRTPMNVIIGFTDLLLEDDNTPAKTKEMLEKINTADNILMGLINDVLDISKVEAGKLDLIPVQYDVAGLLDDIVSLNVIRTESKPIAFKLNIDGSLPSCLFGDDLRIKQILNNLLSNAFKYTEKGNITLGVSSWREGDGRSPSESGSPMESVWISFYVKDTGIGIRKEDMAKLFNDYNQVDTHANRKIRGTGLGLSIAKKFAEMMDGEILVASEYGKGTTFQVRIRQGFVGDQLISKETIESLSKFHYANKEKQKREKLVRPDLSYARVLVVDDFVTNLDVAVGMLSKYKMHVDCITNGWEAVERISAGEPVYNAVFMDHMMPEMDGLEATLEIRALGTKYAKTVPIIALTANAVTGSEQMFLDNGFDAFLSKPFNIMSLDSIIQKWIVDKDKEK
jgi:signal transduction histidine kinase